MNEAFLLLGSNIEPEKNILKALEYLNQNFRIINVSNTWQTKAVGSKAADFLNTAVQLETSLDDHTLKEHCLCQIEELLGRVRQADKNAPRTIDLDIILFNGIVLDEAVFRHAHLILPFSELLPDLHDPMSKQELSTLAKKVKKEALAREYKCLMPSLQKKKTSECAQINSRSPD